MQKLNFYGSSAEDKEYVLSTSDAPISHYQSCFDAPSNMATSTAFPITFTQAKPYEDSESDSDDGIPSGLNPSTALGNYSTNFSGDSVAESRFQSYTTQMDATEQSATENTSSVSLRYLSRVSPDMLASLNPLLGIMAQSIRRASYMMMSRSLDTCTLSYS